MKSILILLLAALLAILQDLYWELHHFVVTKYEISHEKLSGLTEELNLVFLSDLHGNKYGKEQTAILEALRRIAPDLILIGGDMIIGKEGFSLALLHDFMKELTKIAPVYYANGNHEQRMKEEPQSYSASYQDYHDELLSYGIHYLENESELLSLKGVELRISGIEIPSQYYTHFRKRSMPQGVVKSCVGEADAKHYQILLAHNPAYMQRYLEWGADLILSGHLHGGIVRIPGIRGVISPSFDLFPKYSGDFSTEGKSSVVVSKGLGTHTVNLRICNPAELVHLKLSGRAE